MTDTGNDGSQGYFGQQGLTDHTSDYNTQSFGTRQELLSVRTHMPVKIVAVHGGGVGAPPTVDVQPLVKQIDGQGNASSHGVIYGVPCTRPQAGNFTIIHDPVVGDIGHLSIHDRDISALKSSNGAESSPGSFRTHDPADGVYSGQMLNQTTPKNYIQSVPGGGIKLADQFGNVLLMQNGSIAVTGNLTVTGNITAGFGTGDSVTLQKHTHPGTQPPTPGT